MAYRFRMAGHRSLRLQERQAGKGSEQAADHALELLLVQEQWRQLERLLVVPLWWQQEPRLAD